jgi:hypothetical protein
MTPRISFESSNYYKMTLQSRLLYTRFITDYRKRLPPAVFKPLPEMYYKKICLLNGFNYDKSLEEIKAHNLIIIDNSYAYLVGLVRFFMEHQSYSLPMATKLETIMNHSFGELWKEEFDNTLNQLSDPTKTRLMVKLGIKMPEKIDATALELISHFAQEYKQHGHGDYFCGSIPELAQASRLLKVFSFEDIKHRIKQYLESEWNLANGKIDFMYFSRTINNYKKLDCSFQDDEAKARYWEIVNSQKQA